MTWFSIWFTWFYLAFLDTVFVLPDLHVLLLLTWSMTYLFYLACCWHSICFTWFYLSCCCWHAAWLTWVYLGCCWHGVWLTWFYLPPPALQTWAWYAYRWCSLRPVSSGKPWPKGTPYPPLHGAGSSVRGCDGGPYLYSSIQVYILKSNYNLYMYQEL